MIQGFAGIVQNDFSILCEGKVDTEQEQNKLTRAAVRTLSALGMAFAVVLGVRAIAATTVLGAFAKLAIAVGIYVLSHDRFIMSWNLDKPAKNQGKDFVNNILDADKNKLFDIGKKIFKGEDPFEEKENKKLVAHFFTQGTILRPLWDKILF